MWVLFMCIKTVECEKLDCTCAARGKPGLGQGRGGEKKERKECRPPTVLVCTISSLAVH